MTAILIMANAFESKSCELNIPICFPFYKILFFTCAATPYKIRGTILSSASLTDYFASVAVERMQILKTTTISV